MRIFIISFTARGAALALDVKKGLQSVHTVTCFSGSKSCGLSRELLKETAVLKESLADWTKAAFADADAVCFVGACGIAVRSIAPYAADKLRDPAVLVMDEGGRFCISLLSGHAGGANALCRKICGLTGAQPVITTATDVNRRFAVDVFAAENGFALTDRSLAKEISARILEGKRISLYAERGIFTERIEEELSGTLREILEPQGVSLMPEWESTEDVSLMQERGSTEDASGTDLGIYLGFYPKRIPDKRLLWLPPRNVILGLGCRKGTSAEQIEEFLKELLIRERIPFEAVAAIASIDLKRGEPGLLEVCRRRGVEFVTFSAEELSGVEGEFSASDFVKKTTGTDNVCERSAKKAAESYGIFSGFCFRKQRQTGITAAAAVFRGAGIRLDGKEYPKAGKGRRNE